MEITFAVSKAPNIGISSILLIIVSLAPFAGIVFGEPNVTWIIAFGAAVVWIFLTRREAQAGLGLLWGVKVEPAPCDILFIWAWVRRLLKGQVQWPAYLVLNLLAVFVVLNFLQLLWVNSWQRGLFFAGATAYTISLCFYFSSYIQNLQIWKKVRKYYLIAVMVTALTLILLAGVYLLGMTGNLSELYYARRPLGFFKDPNVAGPFVVTGALFALSQILFKRKKLFSRTGAMFFIIVLAAILTFSRGALINLLAGMLGLGLLALWVRKGVRFMGITLVSVLLAIFFMSYLLETFEQTSRFKEGLTYYDLYGRLAAWKAGKQLFLDHPWGFGPGQFEHYSIAYQEALAGPILILTPSAHNLYLRVLAENGLFGFTILLIALLLLVRVSLKMLSLSVTHGQGLLLADGAWLFSSLVGILVESFVIDTLHWRHLWIIAGFILAYFKLIKENIVEG